MLTLFIYKSSSSSKVLKILNILKFSSKKLDKDFNK